MTQYVSASPGPSPPHTATAGAILVRLHESAFRLRCFEVRPDSWNSCRHVLLEVCRVLRVVAGSGRSGSVSSDPSTRRQIERACRPRRTWASHYCSLHAGHGYGVVPHRLLLDQPYVGIRTNHLSRVKPFGFGRGLSGSSALHESPRPNGFSADSSQTVSCDCK